MAPMAPIVYTYSLWHPHVYFLCCLSDVLYWWCRIANASHPLCCLRDRQLTCTLGYWVYLLWIMKDHTATSRHATTVAPCMRIVMWDPIPSLSIMWQNATFCFMHSFLQPPHLVRALPLQLWVTLGPNPHQPPQPVVALGRPKRETSANPRQTGKRTQLEYPPHPPPCQTSQRS